MVFILVYPRETNPSYSKELTLEYEKGLEVLGKGRIHEAIEILTKVAGQGYKEANYWVGFAYQKSGTVFGSPYEEKLWYTKGAKAGDPYAMLALGARKYKACAMLDKCSLWDYYWLWQARVVFSQRAKNGDTDGAYYKLRYIDSLLYDFDNKKDLVKFSNEMKSVALVGNDNASVDYYLTLGDYYDDPNNEALKILKNQVDKYSGGGDYSKVYLASYYRNLVNKGVDVEVNYNKALEIYKSLISNGNGRGISGVSGMVEVYKGQPELDKYIDEGYFYCKVLSESGYIDLWCNPKVEGNYLSTTGFKIPVSKNKRTELELRAKKWHSEHKFIALYDYFSIIPQFVSRKSDKN